jgi:hypothetical protein
MVWNSKIINKLPIPINKILHKKQNPSNQQNSPYKNNPKTINLPTGTLLPLTVTVSICLN